MLKQCSSCERIFTKVPSADCPACAQGDYSDHFSAGELIDVNMKDMFADGASVYMCPKCLSYTREMPQPMVTEDCNMVSSDSESQSDDRGEQMQSSALRYCPECDSEMARVNH